MLVYVMSAEARSGVSKTNNKPYSGIFADIVYMQQNNYRVRTIFINANQLPEGEVPSYGDVLNVEFDFGGYISAVNFVRDKKCGLNVMNSNNGADKH